MSEKKEMVQTTLEIEHEAGLLLVMLVMLVVVVGSKRRSWRPPSHFSG
jgi:hypothetical protein